MSIVVHRTIIHYLNKETNNVILTDIENTSDVELVKDFKKVFKSVLNNEYTRKGVFEDYNNNSIKKLAEAIIYDENTFIDNSKKIAEKLYKQMQLSDSINSGCVAVGLFSNDDEMFVGIFKIDFKKSYTKEIKKLDNNKFRMKMVKNDDLMPEKMTSSQSAIIGASGVNDEYHLYVLDKKPEKEKLDSDFIQKFLEVSKIEDDAYVTKVLKETVNNFLINYYSENVHEAESVRSYFIDIMKNESTISPKELAEVLIDDTEKREVFIEILESKLENLDKTIEIDTDWIEKKTKNRTFKTDTGFCVKGKLEDFNDSTKYSLSKNDDGSVNLTLKNIKVFE